MKYRLRAEDIDPDELYENGREDFNERMRARGFSERKIERRFSRFTRRRRA